MQVEHFGDKLKWEAAESAFKGRIEELQRAAEEHSKELLRTQRDKQEDMALLLDGFLEEDGEDANPGNATFTHKPGHDDKMRQMIKNAMDDAQALREENAQLKEELAAAQRLMTKPKTAAARNKNLRRVAEFDIVPDSETEVELDNSDVDPDWSFSEEKPSMQHRKNTSGAGAAAAHKSAGETTITLNSTIVRCQCKTDCSRKTCSCRKNSLFCHGKCGCKNCVNKDRDSVSDQEGSGPGAIVKRKEDSIGAEDHEEQDSKRRK